MITAGANEKTGGATDRNDPAGRLRLLDTNAAIYQSIIPLLHAVAPEALVLAQIVGEHGTTEVFLWYSARIGGRLVSDCWSQFRDKTGKSCDTRSSGRSDTPTSP
jgi:malate/lactate dehydrogenase